MRQYEWMLYLHQRGPRDGQPVLLIHGNGSSGGYWQPLLRHLPEAWRIVAPDLRGYGASPAAPVDATRGLRDFADDVADTLDTAFEPGAAPIVVGQAMGAGVAMQLTIDHPDRVAALVLEAPVSPYGFGGTRGLDGAPTMPDFAGTGAGAINPEFVRRLAAGDRSTDDPASPRNVMRSMYVANPDAFGPDEEAMLDAVLSTVVGEGNYPGDVEVSDNWPYVAPGKRGVLNAMSPKYLNLTGLVELPGATRPLIVWVHGSADVIVSDASQFDLSHLGQLGLVPGWPGADVSPAQPMLGQTRAVLQRYGNYTEIVYDGCGHSPHIERASDFAELLRSLA